MKVKVKIRKGIAYIYNNNNNNNNFYGFYPVVIEAGILLDKMTQAAF